MRKLQIQILSGSTRLIVIAFALSISAVSILAQEVSLEKTVFDAGEDIVVTFSNGPSNTKDWVGLYGEGTANSPSIVWLYVDGTQSGADGLSAGTLTFVGGLPEGGNYDVRFFENDGYTLLANIAFSVGEPGPSVSTDKSIYDLGEPIVVNFNNGPANLLDWVAIFPEGVSSDEWATNPYLYVDGTQDGEIALASGAVTFADGLTKEGNYDVRFLENDDYTLLAVTTLRVVDLSSSTVFTDKNTYVPGDPILVTFNQGPANPKDWVGLYAAGSPNSPSIIWQYVDGTQSGNEGLASGTLNFEAGLPENGNYEARFFENDGYTVLATVAFSIDADSIILPDPIYFENFDSVAEFSLPEGWSVVDYSVELNFEAAPDDFTSSLYEGWVNVSLDRWQSSDYWVGDKEFGPSPKVLVNGVNQFLSGNFLVADSASRNADFISFLQTADIDLSGHQNIHLAFYSHYQQNQDSFGSVEYSVDAGQTWLPVVYLMDAVDIVTDEDGNVDAVETFFAQHTDIAVGFDDATFVEYGFDFASYIGAVVSPELAPFISGRVDDNSTESKRFEMFRIPGADNNQVRFRIAKTGTWSWYWAIDNFGLYSIAPGGVPTVIEASVPPGDINIHPQPLLEFTIKSGETSLKPDTVRLELDGEPVEGVRVEQVTLGAESGHEVSYQVTGVLEPASTHNYQLSFMDNASPPNDVSYEGSFTVQDYTSIDLPDPLYYENFDNLDEFMLPEGWTRQNYIDPNDPIQYVDDPEDWFSTLYAGWANVTLERWQTSPYWTDKAPGSDPTVVVNGTVQYPSGKFLIADSAARDAQFATTLQTRDYDLSNQSDIHLGFYSHYEQNQDNSASLEYSIDGGQTWLPVLYLMDAVDIVTDGQGNVDAVATFNAEHDDVAVAYDEETFQTEVGRTFGSFIGAEVSQNLAPFISGRIDDNDVASKRYELFRLEQADNQARVRFRVAMNGTFSWYWAVDNFGIYSIDESVSEPVPLSISKSGGEVTLSWQGGAGIRLQQTERLNNPDWQNLGDAGQSSTTQPADQKESYYRLIKD
ncbi:MAG TPA: hypothetical protein EYQ50_15375 [Verrucomicrobiales bacterium]|nr:hypothetical protein [Verrucomicrobiales bacterium]